jgi:hypothetical protein
MSLANWRQRRRRATIYIEGYHVTEGGLPRPAERCNLRLTSHYSRIPIARLPALAVLSLGLALAVACGGGSSSTSTPTSAVSGSASASPGGGSGSASASSRGGSGTPQASGAVSATPGPTAVECTPAAPDAGLVSQVYFNAGGRFAAGTPVEITLVLADCAKNDSVLYFPTAQRYHFTVADSNGVELWSSSDGKSYDQTVGTETLHRGRTATYTETWDQKDRSGNQVPAGQYKVSAFSVGCIATPRSGCELGPVGFIQIQAAPGA